MIRLNDLMLSSWSNSRPASPRTVQQTFVQRDVFHTTSVCVITVPPSGMFVIHNMCPSLSCALPCCQCILLRFTHCSQPRPEHSHGPHRRCGLHRLPLERPQLHR